MPLRVIRRVWVDSSSIHLNDIKPLGALYPHHALRCTVLRHFDSNKALVRTLNETVEAFYATTSMPKCLLVTSDLARRFGIVSEDYLELLITHARSNSEDSMKRLFRRPTDELVFPERDHADLEFDPDAPPDPVQA
jgi:hypothetical protein